MRVARTYPCVRCGVVFRPKKSDRKTYCSRDCARAAWVGGKAERAEARRAAVLADRREAAAKIPCAVCARTGWAASLLERLCGDACRKRRACDKARESNAAKHDLRERKCVGCGAGFVAAYGSKRRQFCSGTCATKAAKRVYGHNHRERARYHGVPYEPVNVVRVLERDGWRCQICGCDTPRKLRGTNHPKAPEIDHRVPMARGGAHSYANVQAACRRCNGAKGASAETGQLPMWDKVG